VTRAAGLVSVAVDDACCGDDDCLVSVRNGKFLLVDSVGHIFGAEFDDSL